MMWGSGKSQNFKSIILFSSFVFFASCKEQEVATDTLPQGDSSSSAQDQPSLPNVSEIQAMPGGGFDEEAPDAGLVGDPTKVAADQRAVGRWSTVPYQTYSSNFKIGVVADHFHGIQKVEFSVDGGPWTAVSTPQTNPETGVFEYTISLSISDFSDGQHEIQAIVYPNHGLTRVLAGPLPSSLNTGNHSLFFSTNRDSTLPSKTVWVANDGDDVTGNGTELKPFKTLGQAGFALANNLPGGDASGGRIYLKAGDYNLGNYSYGKRFDSLNRWITIEPAPGVSKSSARIVSASMDGLRTDLVRLKGLTIAPTSGAPYVIRNVNNRGLVWIEDCHFTSQNFDDNSSLLWFMGWKSNGQFITESTAYHVRGTPYSGALVRNTTIEFVADDAYKNAIVILNATIKNLQDHGTGHHPDVWQAWAPNGTMENFFVQNLTAIDSISAQGLFFHGWTNLYRDGAFRDVKIDNSFNGVGTVFVNLHMHRPVQHLLFRNCILSGGGLYRTGDDPSKPQTSHNIFSAQDMLMENVFEDASKENFVVPYPDGPSVLGPGTWPGTIPWLSPLGVNYTTNE